MIGKQKTIVITNKEFKATEEGVSQKKLKN